MHAHTLPETSSQKIPHSALVTTCPNSVPSHSLPSPLAVCCYSGVHHSKPRWDVLHVCRQCCHALGRWPNAEYWGDLCGRFQKHQLERNLIMPRSTASMPGRRWSVCTEYIVTSPYIVCGASFVATACTPGT